MVDRPKWKGSLKGNPKPGQIDADRPEPAPLPRDTPLGSPTSPQDALRRPQGAPKNPQGAPKMAKDAPKMAQHGPRRPQDRPHEAPRRAQEPPVTAQDAPVTPQHIGSSEVCVCDFFRRTPRFPRTNINTKPQFSGVPGASWRGPGALLGHLGGRGGSWARLGASWGASWAVLGASWDVLGRLDFPRQTPSKCGLLCDSCATVAGTQGLPIRILKRFS